MPYKRGKSWMAQVRINDKKHRKTFPTKAAALAWEVEQRENKEPSFPSVQIRTVSLADWATKYMDYAQVKFSATTYDEKKRMFKMFFNSVDPHLPVGSLTSGMVLDFLQGQASSRSGYAANKDRKNLVAAWNWGMKYLGLPSPNPCLVDRFPEERQKRYVPPEKDFWKVFEHASTAQDEVMLLAYLHLAARRSELFGLRWDDVDFSEQKIRLYTRKRRDGSLEFDWLPLTDDLHNALLTHRQVAKTEWVFPDPETGKPYLYRIHWMNRLCKKAGVKKFGLHAIRHLTASILAKENVPMIDIQSILRHKNLSTTERYIRRLDSIRPALRVLPGRKSPHSESAAHTTKKGKQLKVVDSL
ncbi:tyrosine-type recombinase/integrase [Thiovibrio sp. JS02]